MTLTVRDSKIMEGQITISDILRETWRINTHSVADRYFEYLRKIQGRPGKYVVVWRVKVTCNEMVQVMYV